MCLDAFRINLLKIKLMWTKSNKTNHALRLCIIIIIIIRAKWKRASTHTHTNVFFYVFHLTVHNYSSPNSVCIGMLTNIFTLFIASFGSQNDILSTFTSPCRLRSSSIPVGGSCSIGINRVNLKCMEIVVRYSHRITHEIHFVHTSVREK